MKTALIIMSIMILSVSCGKKTTVIQGTKGDTGISGTNGTNGVDGINGTNGVDGQDSTNMTYMVNLCDNRLRENRFSEEAICVSDNGSKRLYAVMSGGTSVLVELLDDTEYTTNSPNGNNCRFYKGSGCDVKFIEEI